MVKKGHDKVGVSFLGMGILLSVIGLFLLIYCGMMASRISELPFPRDTYAWNWGFIYPMMSFYLLIFGLIFTFGALVRLNVISGNTVLVLLILTVVIILVLGDISRNNLI